MTAERPNPDFLLSVLATGHSPHERNLGRRMEAAARRQRREAFLAKADSILVRWGQEVDSRVLGTAEVQAQVRVGAGEAAVDLLLWRRLTILAALGGFLTTEGRLYEISLRRAGEEEFRRFFSPPSRNPRVLNPRMKRSKFASADFRSPRRARTKNPRALQPSELQS